jgi:hypothetical protein
LSTQAADAGLSPWPLGLSPRVVHMLGWLYHITPKCESEGPRVRGTHKHRGHTSTWQKLSLCIPTALLTIRFRVANRSVVITCHTLLTECET